MKSTYFHDQSVDNAIWFNILVGYVHRKVDTLFLSVHLSVSDVEVDNVVIDEAIKSAILNRLSSLFFAFKKCFIISIST